MHAELVGAKDQTRTKVDVRAVRPQAPHGGEAHLHCSRAESYRWVSHLFLNVREYKTDPVVRADESKPIAIVIILDTSNGSYEWPLADDYGFGREFKVRNLRKC